MRLVSVFVWMCKARAVLAKLLELAKYAESVNQSSAVNVVAPVMPLVGDAEP